MNKVRKILVPINFSEESANGLKYAVSLAEKTQAEVVVLHVTQKKEADSFSDLLAVMEGSPMLNRPAAIPVDRLLREKALDLYRFVEKVVEDVQQSLQDEFIDTTWPACPRHSNHPLNYVEGAWRCPRNGAIVAPLGSLK